MLKVTFHYVTQTMKMSFAFVVKQSVGRRFEPCTGFIFIYLNEFYKCI